LASGKEAEILISFMQMGLSSRIGYITEAPLLLQHSGKVF
jgi:hypothetical protein